LQITGKTALVSGSTAGIGLAIATELAREGAAVIINGRTQKRVDEALAQIKSAVPKANLRGVAADLGTVAGVATMVKAVPAVDMLVNNLGIFTAKGFFELDDSDWQHAFEVNVMSGVRLCRAYFQQMLKNNSGSILFISSESAVLIPVEMIQYGMTKTAQVSVARGLAEMTAGTNVTVNSLLVGPTRSEGVEQFLKEVGSAKGMTEKQLEDDFFKSIRPTSLIKRFETTEEIGRVAAFLVSGMASSINGAAIRAEGGLLKGAF